MNDDLGGKIRKLRRKNKDTLQSLAEKIDYDFSNLSKVERGTYSATLELIQKIVAHYNVDPKYFFGEGFTNSETDLLMEEDLTISELKKKYDFVIDDVEATEEEIIEAIRMIRHFRSGKD